MITVHWDDSHKDILRCDFYDPIATWEEYNQAIAEAAALLQSIDHPVYLMFTPGRARMPAGSPIPHIRQALVRLNLPTCRMVIAVIQDHFALDVITTMVRVLFRGRFRVAGSLESAYAIIDQDVHDL